MATNYTRKLIYVRQESFHYLSFLVFSHCCCPKKRFIVTNRSRFLKYCMFQMLAIAI